MKHGTPTAHPAVSVEDDSVHGRHGTVPIRRYRPTLAEPTALVVWAHGGGFSHGGLDQLESHAVGLALAEAGFAVTAVDYRRVPPWSWWRKPKTVVLGGIRYPVPLEDVLDVLASAQAEADAADLPLVLGGASAGACLSAAAALRLSEAGVPGPSRMLFAYGNFHALLPPIPEELRARIRGRHGLLQFRASTVERMHRNYAGSREAMEDPHAFPGGHDLRGLPPALFLDADRDSLRASGGKFGRELREAGVDVDYQVVPRATHGFFDRPASPAFADGIQRAVLWLRSPRPAHHHGGPFDQQ